MLRYAIVAFLIAGGAMAAADDVVTTEKLLGQMTDMEELTTFPDPSYKTIQFSSYDRRSEGPYKPGWYANSDGFGREPIPGFVRVEEEPGDDGVGTYVMAEVDGPGAIVRTWTAAIGGTIQLFLDGADEPIYDGPAKGFLDNPYAAVGGDESILEANGYNQREAGYFPIPFSESCRILWTGRKRNVHFYQIQIRCYESGTEVETFTPDDLDRYNDAVKQTSRLLANPDDLEPEGVREEWSFEIEELAPEGRETVFEDEQGPAAISSFSVEVDAHDTKKALRGTVLRMFFDGSPTPQVEAPLGDFFGAGPGICPYSSVPMTVEPDGTMICRFVMPYAESARVELENWSGVPVQVEGEMSISDYEWVDGRSMHFFAHWRADHELMAKHNNRVFDLPYLCAHGKGLYVGSAAMLMNPTRVPTPGGGWWGEGDEKIWVDGDDFPSTFGTGSEDYYNYAWSTPDLFSHAYFAQPITTGPGNRGYVTNNRWHIIDPLPFKHDIFFFMELYPHMPTPGLSYARAAYFYAFPTVRDDHIPLQPAKAQVPELPSWTPLAEGQARNALFLQAEDVEAEATGGTVRIREEDKFSGGKALWWENQGADDTLEIKLDVEERGDFRIGLTALLTPDSDHAKVLLGGEPIYTDGRAIDLHTPHLTILRNRRGNRKFTLEQGVHTLTVKACDAEGNPSEASVGIDFIWLQK